MSYFFERFYGEDRDPPEDGWPMPITHMRMDATEQFVQKIYEKKRTLLRDAIENTDWSETTALDFVWAGSEPSGEGFQMLHPKSRIVRHTEPSPPPTEDSAIPGRRCEVFRITPDVAFQYEIEDILGDDA